MKKYLLFWLLLLSLSFSYGQNDTLSIAVSSDSVESTMFLGPYVKVFADTTGQLGPGELKEGWFQQYSKQVRKRISKRIMSEGYVWFRFRVRSVKTDTTAYYVTSGPLTREITLFQREPMSSEWTELKKQQTKGGEKAYALFRIQSVPETEVLARVRFAKTNVSLFSPYIINDDYLRYHLSFLHNHWFGLNTVTYLLVGALLMMLIFSVGSFLQNGKKEFLYYSLYALSLGALLYLKAITYNKSEEFTFFNEEYLDFLLLMAGYLFYISFSRIFLNTRSEMPFLNRLLLGAEFIVMLCMLLFTWFYFTGKNYDLLNNLENASKYFMIFVGLCFVVLGIIKRNRIWNYLMAGNIANLFMAGFSQYMIIFPNTNLVPPNGLFRQSLFYFELGILLEMFLFLAGLNYKNKIELIEKVKMKEALKQESERKEYEKQIAVLSAQQEERSRISADMHDELGSGVTAIRLLSEIARKKTKDQPLEELSKISFNANDLMVKMNGIIWSMNPGHDSLDSFISYIRAYASEYCETVHIALSFIPPKEIPPKMLAGNVRRNLFLVIKESLNNIIKHAGATEVRIIIQLTPELEIQISDNGKGIDDAQTSRFGNGLKNMDRRMQSVGGSYSITSAGAGSGTTTTLRVALDA